MTKLDAEPILSVTDLTRHFAVGGGLLRRAAVVRAVDGVSFDVGVGETLALVGESGCGKTTVGRLALRLLEPTSGTVRFEGGDLGRLSATELRRRRARMQIIFQDPYASLNPRMTVGETIAEPIRFHGIAGGAGVAERAAELLGLVGLSTEHLQRYPHQFSGGQRQRIGIARALASQPSLIICDEPVSALDVSVQAQIVNLLQDIQRRLKLSLLFISHDLGVVRHISQRVAVMYLGQIVELAPTRDLYRHSRHPYSHALIESAPVARPAQARAAIDLSGEMPNPVAPPSGCRFHTRCPHAVAECARIVPGLEQVAPGHFVACLRWREIALPAAVRERVAPTNPVTPASRRQKLFELALQSRRDRLASPGEL